MDSRAQEEREVRAARNQSMFRAVNENITAVNQPFAGMTETFAIACECYDASCLETIHIRSEDYFQVRADPRQFVVSPGHVLPEVETVVHETNWWVVVEKTDTAGDVAALLDPSDGSAKGRTA